MSYLKELFALNEYPERVCVVVVSELVHSDRYYTFCIQVRA